MGDDEEKQAAWMLAFGIGAVVVLIAWAGLMGFAIGLGLKWVWDWIQPILG
jgi:hypothetical protein